MILYYISLLLRLWIDRIKNRNTVFAERNGSSMCVWGSQLSYSSVFKARSEQKRMVRILIMSFHQCLSQCWKLIPYAEESDILESSTTERQNHALLKEVLSMFKSGLLFFTGGYNNNKMKYIHIDTFPIIWKYFNLRIETNFTTISL